MWLYIDHNNKLFDTGAATILFALIPPTPIDFPDGTDPAAFLHAPGCSDWSEEEREMFEKIYGLIIAAMESK